MGREDTLEVLKRIAASKENRNRYCLHLIVPHLFVPKPNIDPKEIPWLEETIADGIPFDTNPSFGSSVVRIDPDWTVALDWAQNHCNFLDTQIVPTNTPFQTVRVLTDRLCRKHQKVEIDGELVDVFRSNYQQKLNQQVFEMIDHLLPSFRQPEFGWMNDMKRVEDLESICNSRQLHWNAENQAYEFNN